jgi:hypothetical protein
VTACDKDVEILALRHQVTVLERQLGMDRPAFTAAGRAFLAALLQSLPRKVRRRLRLIVHPETILRWHRDLIRRRHANTSKTRQRWRPSTVRSVRVLVLPLVRENPSRDTGAFTVSSPRWASPSLPRPCGRSSRQRASIQHRSTDHHHLG